MFFSACAGVPRGWSLSPVSMWSGTPESGTRSPGWTTPSNGALTRVTAEYSKSDSGDILVLNRGFDEKKKKWKTIEGRAVFVGSSRVGSLKVSFFGPFYAGYHIIALDRENYRYALISGATRSYLWILARTPQLDPAIVNDLVAQAEQAGFETERLIYVDQSPIQE